MKAGLFSVYRWRMRFRYALQGILVFCRTEHNAIIYSLSTIAVFIASLMKGVTKIEATALVIVIGFVWVSELFNTAIECLADLITLKTDARVKNIKDVAAGAVLLSVVAAVITGLLIFIPKFYRL